MKSITLSKKDVERFWSKVDVREGNECWEWNAHINNKGYGVFGIKDSVYLAHRVSLSIKLEKNVPSEMLVIHSCDNPKCVNPNHLSLGTPRDNMQDMIAKGRRVQGYVLRGEENVLSKLRNEDIPEIRRMFNSGMTTRAIAKIYNVDSKTVWSVAKRISWKHIG